MNISKRMRICAAQSLLNDLESKKKISDDELESVLGPEQWNQLQEISYLIREARHTKSTPHHITQAMRPYIERLAEADKLDSLAERTRLKSMPSASKLKQMKMRGISIAGLSSSREVFRRNAEIAYERAIEKLQEIIEEFPEVASFLDRKPIFNGENFNVSPDPEGVPRLRTSRSQYNIARRTHRQSLRSAKIDALRELINKKPGYQ